MRIVIAGGSGQLGQLLARTWGQREHDCVILARRESVPAGRLVHWDGRSLEPAWAGEVDGADVVVNLAGRSVNCRYTDENRRAMMDSRVDSTRVVGEAIAQAAVPPPLWIQMSTATIYAHTFGEANDEVSGIIGGDESDVPRSWDYSVEIAKTWERTLDAALTPSTRKVVLRTTMVMTPDEGGIFDTLHGIAKKGLGGKNASGKQFISWIHGADFVAALDHIIADTSFHGVVNMAAPEPVTNAEFMKTLRELAGVSIGLPATKWMIALGAVFMRTESELVLKSRRVVSKRLADAGFRFQFPDWKSACSDLVDRLG